MTTRDKAKTTTDQTKGKLKEAASAIKLRAEGIGEQKKAHLKQAGEKIKDAFNK